MAEAVGGGIAPSKSAEGCALPLGKCPGETISEGSAPIGKLEACSLSLHASAATSQNDRRVGKYVGPCRGPPTYIAVITAGHSSPLQDTGLVPT